MTGEQADKLIAAVERIATVVERIEADEVTNTKFARITAIWDGWFNDKTATMRPVLDAIGDVIYEPPQAL